MKVAAGPSVDLTLRDPAPSGAIASFVSTKPSVYTVPSTATAAAGATTLSAPLTRVAYGSSTIVATYAGTTETATVYNEPPAPHVNPPPVHCVGLCQ
jgi:hypothetical protein